MICSRFLQVATTHDSQLSSDNDGEGAICGGGDSGTNSVSPSAAQGRRVGACNGGSTDPLPSYFDRTISPYVTVIFAAALIQASQGRNIGEKISGFLGT